MEDITAFKVSVKSNKIVQFFLSTPISVVIVLNSLCLLYLKKEQDKTITA